MVLFVFVIMLLNAGEEERTNMSRMARYVGVPLADRFAVANWRIRWARATLSMTAQPAADGAIRGLSMLLFQDFVFPFELTSILILIAILGALVLAQRREGASAKREQQNSQLNVGSHWQKVRREPWCPFPTTSLSAPSSLGWA